MMLKNEVRKVKDELGDVYVRRRNMARGVEYSAWESTTRSSPFGRAAHSTTSTFSAPGRGLTWFGLLDTRRELVDELEIAKARARAQSAISTAFPESLAAGDVPTSPGCYREIMKPDLVVVGCVKGKRDEGSAARDLYDSPLFEKRRAAAEAVDVPWFILSAKYGLINPDVLIQPYERTIADLTAERKEEFGKAALRTLRSEAPISSAARPAKVWVLAGLAYANVLRRGLAPSEGYEIVELVEPLAGMQIGERLAWYNEFLSGVDSEG